MQNYPEVNIMDTTEFINMLCWFDCNIEFGNLDGEFDIIITINSSIDKSDLYDLIEFIEEHSDASNIRIYVGSCIEVVR